MVKGKLWLEIWSIRWIYFILIWSNSTFQKTHFHRAYAAYGGIFIMMAIGWGYLLEGIIPDVYDIIGTIVASIGVMIIFFYPRKKWKQLESIAPIDYGFIFIFSTFVLLVFEAIAEVSEGYLVWL